jgi:hypothetical protein
MEPVIRELNNELRQLYNLPRDDGISRRALFRRGLGAAAIGIALAAGAAKPAYAQGSGVVKPAHFKDAKIEIYKAITVPNIDGKYDMTLKEVEVNGKKVMTDEWSDATWVEIPKNLGSMTAYSGYKYDEKFLYMAHDLISVTESSFNKRGSAGTCFDPLHDGGFVKARPDDFIVLPIWGGDGGEGFHMYLRHGQTNGNYGHFQPAPKNLIANSNISTSPFSSTPHLFYEVQVPLTVGNLYKYIDSTIGIFQEVYNVSASGEESDNRYPMADYVPAVDNYADATFSKNTNPNPASPPTIVPEYGSPQLVAGGVLTAALLLLSFYKALNKH